MSSNFTDDERNVLIGLLVGVIENDPFPQSTRIQQLRGIVTKLRMGLSIANAPDGAVAPDTTEAADIDEAEALSFGAEFRSRNSEASDG